MEILPPEAAAPETMIDVLRGGAAITKAENDTLSQVAITRPRNAARSLQTALAELELDPAFAEKQYYVIPYKNADGTTTNIEGLSIKAAMALARTWGNCTTSARLIEETPDAFLVEGVAIDFETNFRVSKIGSVSKYYRNRKTGAMVKWRDDKYPQLLGAAASKQVRNAILNMIPEALQRRYWSRAKEIAAGDKAPLDVKAEGKKILAAFAPFGVEAEHLEGKIGHPLKNLTKADVGLLRGIYNALAQGQTTAWEAFGVEAPQEGEETTAAPQGSPLGGEAD
jgi:hypothetical protein